MDIGNIIKALKGISSSSVALVGIFLSAKWLMTPDGLPYWMRFTGYVLALACIMWIALRNRS